MSPASHFFFFEKVEKNNDNKSVHSCRRNTSGKLLVPLLVPDVFSRNRAVSRRRDRMQLHAIACDLMLPLQNTREGLHFLVEFMICVRSLRQTLLFSEV